MVGEVGAKWVWKDSTRTERDLIDVQKTIDAFELFLEAGCEKMVLGGLDYSKSNREAYGKQTGQNDC